MMKEEIRHADNEKIDLKVWKRLVDYGLQYKARVIRTILVLLVVSGADLAYPLFTRYAINHFIMGETTEGLGLFGALYIIMVLAQGAGVMLFVRGAGRLEMDISYDIRQDAFTHLQQLSFSYYDTTSVGWLMARLGSDVSRLSEMIAWSVVDVMWALFFAVGVVIVLLVMNWKLGLLVFLLLLSVKVYRPFCQYLCPLGAIYGWFNRFSLVQIRWEKEKCISCGACERACPVALDVQEISVSPECIRCGKCVGVCPTKCLHLSGSRVSCTVSGKEKDFSA